MGVIEGGTAILFAIVIYALFYGIAGAQIRKIIIADEEPGLRVFWFFGAVFVSIMVWAILGGVVYWGILIWFRVWLRDPHAWRPAILSSTGWFPFGLLFKYTNFPAGGIRLLLVFVGYPITLLIAAGIVAVGLRVRERGEIATMRQRRGGTGAGPRTKEIAQ